MAADRAYGLAVDAIYVSIERQSGWLNALEAIAACMGDVGAIFIYPRGDGSLGTIVTPGLEDVQAQFSSAEWATRDLRYERALERGYVASGQCVTDRHVVTEEEMETDPYYLELLRPHGLKYFAGMNISPTPSAVAAISVQRGSDKPPFSDEELEIVERLGRHVESALRIGLRLEKAESQAPGEGRVPVFAAIPEARSTQQSELSEMLARLAGA